jgi:phosphoribosylanthranilate isomerase
MTKVKICGITTLDDALFAAEAGADLLGFNFYKKSPRYIAPEVAQTICHTLHDQFKDRCPVLVGIFVNMTNSDVANILHQTSIAYAQLSGDESDEMIRELRGKAYKAIQPMTVDMAADDAKYYSPYFPKDDHIPSLLVDAYHAHLRGGTGEQVSAAIALSAKTIAPRLMLAGGLTPENVSDRIEAVLPWGVDVASGVEGDTPGIKDPEKIKAFIAAAKSVSV